MKFVVICRDKADSQATRDALMPQHKPYIAPFVDQFLVGGFIGGSDGCVGSLIVCEADSEEDARQIFMNDPYYGTVWESLEVYSYEPMAGQWIGGPTWER